MTTTDAPTTRSEKLRAASRNTHSRSDALVNARLVGLFASQKTYAGALGCFWYVFRKLEECMEQVIASNEVDIDSSRYLLALYNIKEGRISSM